MSTVSFADKVVLITGTARGCGAVLAEAFAHDGATIVACDVDGDGGEAAAEKIRGAGGAIDFTPADVSSEEEVEALVAGALETHGRLDCAINNAGTEELSEIAEGTESAFDELIATDLKGLFFCLKHEIRAMRSGGGGAILNMSSVTSSITAAPANGLYAATKGGVNGLTKAPAIEVGKDNISVNALAFRGDRHPRQHDLALPGRAAGAERSAHAGLSGGADGPAGRARPCGDVPVLRRGALLHRYDTDPGRRLHGPVATEMRRWRRSVRPRNGRATRAST
jgi:NAD(P)-dependent dehydrogenase (short-subunit alcohol dehydrogenase family)